MTNPIGITKRARVMDSEVLARFVQAKMVKAFRDVRPFVEELWKRFAALKPGQHIHGCATKKEYCENILQRTPRAVQYMLAGGNPENEKRKAREIISRPALPAPATQKIYLNLKVGDMVQMKHNSMAIVREINEHIVLVYDGDSKRTVLFDKTNGKIVNSDTKERIKALCPAHWLEMYAEDIAQMRAALPAATSEAVDAEFVDEPVSQSAEKEPEKKESEHAAQVREHGQVFSDLEKVFGVDRVRINPYYSTKYGFRTVSYNNCEVRFIIDKHKLAEFAEIAAEWGVATQVANGKRDYRPPPPIRKTYMELCVGDNVIGFPHDAIWTVKRVEKDVFWVTGGVGSVVKGLGFSRTDGKSSAGKEYGMVHIPYECLFCDKLFRSYSKLRQHARDGHAEPEPASASPAKEIRIAAAQKEYDSTVGFNRQTRKAARERLEAAKKDAPASPAPPKEEKFMRMNLSSGKRPEARTDDELLKAIAYARKNQEWYPSQLENILEQVKPFIGEALKRGLTVPVAPAPKAKP